VSSRGSRMERALRRAEQGKASPALGRCLEDALTLAGGAVGRHFLCAESIEVTYRLRDVPGMRERCERACREQIPALPSCAGKLSAGLGLPQGRLPKTPAHLRPAVIPEKRGDIREAIAVCQQAMMYGPEDGAKAGFTGRVDRLVCRLDDRTGAPSPAPVRRRLARGSGGFWSQRIRDRRVRLALGRRGDQAKACCRGGE